MDREPPPLTGTGAGSGGAPPDVLEGAPTPSRRLRPTGVLALVAVVVLGAASVRGEEGSGAPAPVPSAPVPSARSVQWGITATASLAGAATDRPDVQRLALTVDLPPFDGRADSGGRLLGDEMLLVDVRARGLAVVAGPDGSPVPLGRFGRTTSVRSTTVPLTAVVGDCALEPQAPGRDLVLSVRTGGGPEVAVRAVADADVVRALEQLVRRTCRRPRG